MITCEWGWIGIPQIKRCMCNAEFLVKFVDGHPLTISFGEYNFLCARHLKALERRKKVLKYEVYEIREYKEKVQFT